MKKSLFFSAVSKFSLGVLCLSLLLFLPAGTLDYPPAWLLMGILFLPMFAAGIVMLLKAPNLLRSRLKAKEEQAEQSLVIKLSALMFLTGFLLAGFSWRFQRYLLPEWASPVGCTVFLLSYLLYAEVLRENAYLSRVIEVQEGQKVVDTGLYAIVRHPMYSVTVFLFLSMPLVLRSSLAFLVFLVYPLLIAKRIRNEEEVLEAGLEGYSDYKKRVKYKMIPFVW